MTEDEQEDERFQKLYREASNPIPLLAPEQIPSFQLKEARLEWLQDRPSRYIDERWTKKPPPSSGSVGLNFVVIRIDLEQSHEAAIQSARQHFHAKIEDDQTPAIGKPLPGSYSGQLIGDYCWVTTDKAGKSRAFCNPSASVIVVTGSASFQISVSGPGDTGEGHPDSLVESLAQAVVARLRTWKLPPDCEP